MPAAVMPMTTLGPGGPAVSRVGLGLAALGRPAYITGGRASDLPDRSIGGLRDQSFLVLDAAYGAGVRYFDAARSYGRAEEFLGEWLASRDHPDAVCGSKWGYRYTGDWQLDAAQHEVKEHTLAMFTKQLAQTRGLLGDRLALYQVHSLTEDSPLLGDADLLAALGQLRDEGVRLGISTSGPGQAATLRRAMQAAAGGKPLFSVAQVTWNLLETSVAPAAAEAAGAGWTVLVKEAMANGRLAPGTGPGAPPPPLAEAAAAAGTSTDALAIATALACPWAAVVLSGAATPAQLQANLTALEASASEVAAAVLDLGLAEEPKAYWTKRAARPWQ
jgi:aryl-alcohol dehydrogenase-like predicted oxidoreductase